MITDISFYPVYLISVSNGHTFDFLPNLLTRSFLDIEKKNQKLFFYWRVPFRSCKLILNGTQNFKFIGFIYATMIGSILYSFQDTSTRLG